MAEPNDLVRDGRQPPTPPPSPPAPIGGLRGLRARVWAARLALGWERLWPALWRAACVAGAFVTLALLDVLPVLPGWVHAAALAVAGLGLVAVLVRGFRGFRWPGEDDSLRRLERDNDLAHRPLGLLRDRPAAGADADPLIRGIWAAHRTYTLSRLGRLRVAPPRTNVGARDRLHLRAVVAVSLAVAAGVTWGDWGPRLRAALLPRLDSPGRSMAAALDIWLVPPEHIGTAPLFLQRAGTARGESVAARPEGTPAATPVPVPVGSTIMARVSGGVGIPMLAVNDGAQAFTAIDADHYQISETVHAGTSVAVQQDGRTLGRWTLRLIPDLAPTVAFASPPATTERNTLRLEYQATDDYGIKTVTATVRPAGTAPGDSAAGLGSDGDEAGEPSLLLALPVPGGTPKSARQASVHDLTAHPWAGLPVLLRLIATDVGGNKGVSDEVAITLPERHFAQPVARAIIAQRKILIQQGHTARNPVARALGELLQRPRAFHDDVVVFLALRVAMTQLFLESGGAALAAVRDLLWETALRLEDGGLSLAERDLHAAERALAEALERNASPEELRQRMDELQAALDRFLEAMERQAAQNPNQGTPPGPATPPDPDSMVVDRSDLEAMMQQLRDMAETGSREGAQQMLNNLRDLLDNLRTGQGEGASGAPDPRAQQLLQDLQQLTGKQRDLLDRSWRQSGPSGAGPMPLDIRPRSGATNQGGPDQRSAQAQGELRSALGGIMQRLGELTGDIPRPLGQAERAMRDAEQALREGEPDAAMPAQSRAVEQLQQALRGLARQMAAGAGTGQAGRDPLGRMRSGRGAGDTNEVKLPQERELQRARDILDELRRRAGQHERPRPELDYIERLLHQF